MRALLYARVSTADMLIKTVEHLQERVDCLPSSDEIQAILRGILVVIKLMLEIEDREYFDMLNRWWSIAPPCWNTKFPPGELGVWDSHVGNAVTIENDAPSED